MFALFSARWCRFLSIAAGLCSVWVSRCIGSALLLCPLTSKITPAMPFWLLGYSYTTPIHKTPCALRVCPLSLSVLPVKRIVCYLDFLYTIKRGVCLSVSPSLPFILLVRSPALPLVLFSPNSYECIVVSCRGSPVSISFGRLFAALLLCLIFRFFWSLAFRLASCAVFVVPLVRL